MNDLIEMILDAEDWLIDRILYYAMKHQYAQYTATLRESWRKSISGLSESIVKALDRAPDNFELSPDDDYMHDSISAFGIIEAKRHRARGVRLDMFLGLMKYYRESYLDLLRQSSLEDSKRDRYFSVIQRFFDRVEIGFCCEWATTNPEHLEELQHKNRDLTNEKNKYLTVFESFPQAVILLNRDLSIDNFNQASVRLMVNSDQLYDFSQSSGKNLYGNQVNILKIRENISEVVSLFQSDIEEFRDSGKLHHLLEKRCSILGSRRCFDIKLAKMMDVSGKYSGIIMILKDVTISKKKEKEKERMEMQLLHSDKMASIGQLAAGVAHEINNPTGYVGSNLNRLKEYFFDFSNLLEKYRNFRCSFMKEGKNINLMEIVREEFSKIRKMEDDIDIDFLIKDISELIDESREGIDRIQNIVSNLKDFAHPEQNERIYANINSCIDSTLNIVWNEIKYKAGVIKEFGALPEIYCEPRKLNQVFMNIIINAAQSIERDGEIVIRTFLEGEEILIQFQDNGSGIKEKDLKHIFNPFFTTKPVGQGTGLGLHIAYQIIEHHHGKIEVQSTLGKGTVFTIHLPLASPSIT